MEKVLLFDLDWVLVRPEGYRRSLRAVLDFFARRMGMEEIDPGEAHIARFEAISMGSEWDITPICLAAVIDAILLDFPALKLPGDLMAACEVIRGCGCRRVYPDYAGLAQRLAMAYQPGILFANLALQLCEPGTPDPPFPRLVGEPLAAAILADTRSIEGALTTRLFQNYALGSQTFEQTYRIPSLVKSESMLQLYDELLLEPALAESLAKSQRTKKMRLSVFTGRPSQKAPGGSGGGWPYSGEAEIVLEKLGWQDVPLVGFGQVYQLADATSLPLDQINKPAIIHALAAILAAFGKDPNDAMGEAFSWVVTGRPGSFSSLPPFELHIFEDSPKSVESVIQSGPMLRTVGVKVDVHAWGVGNEEGKCEALRKVGVRIIETVNEGL